MKSAYFSTVHPQVSCETSFSRQTIVIYWFEFCQSRLFHVKHQTRLQKVSTAANTTNSGSLCNDSHNTQKFHSYQHSIKYRTFPQSPHVFLKLRTAYTQAVCTTNSIVRHLKVSKYRYKSKNVCPREELNHHFVLRTDLFYPLNYKGCAYWPLPTIPYIIPVTQGVWNQSQ